MERITNHGGLTQMVRFIKLSIKSGRFYLLIINNNFVIFQEYLMLNPVHRPPSLPLLQFT